MKVYICVVYIYCFSFVVLCLTRFARSRRFVRGVSRGFYTLLCLNVVCDVYYCY